MRLAHRLTTPADFPRCFSLLWDHALFSKNDTDSLFAFWQQILHQRLGNSGVLEDQDRPFPPRIVMWGISAFITEAFAEELHSLRSARIGYQAWRWWQEGRDAVLSPEQVQKANSREGLILCTLHTGIGLNPEITNEFLIQCASQTECFIHHHRGFRLRGCLGEFSDERLLPPFLASNIQAYGKMPLHLKDEELRHRIGLPEMTTLVGITREEALLCPFSAFGPIYAYHPPRFLFNPRQQALLFQAFDGRTDEEIAAAEDRTLSSIKKRWTTIYERVAQIEPKLLSEMDGMEEGKRGTEKRRHLLAYLQAHPEELRPFDRQLLLQERTAPSDR